MRKYVVLGSFVLKHHSLSHGYHKNIIYDRQHKDSLSLSLSLSLSPSRHHNNCSVGETAQHHPHTSLLLCSSNLPSFSLCDVVLKLGEIAAGKLLKLQRSVIPRDGQMRRGMQLLSFLLFFSFLWRRSQRTRTHIHAHRCFVCL